MGKGLAMGTVVLALCATMTGGTANAADCGGLLQPACPAPTTPTTPTTPATPPPPPEPTPISEGRYAALEPALAAQQALDASSPSGADVAAARRACDALGTADPLLKGVRGTCLKVAGVLRASGAVETCRGGRACLRALNGLVSATRDWARANHRQTQAVDRAVKDRGCRTALRVSKHDLNIIDRIAPAFRALVDAAKTRGSADDKRAQKRLDAVPFGDLRTYTAAYRAFTADCR